MASGHGGYRRPSNPAPVSGPGALSRRTDGGPAKMDLPDAQYGEAKTFDEIQSGAPLGASGGTGASVLPAAPTRPVVGLNEPSAMPGTPVTAGADAGPGVGSEALGLGPSQLDREQFGKYLPFFMKLANDPETPKSVRTMVRQMFAKS